MAQRRGEMTLADHEPERGIIMERGAQDGHPPPEKLARL